MRPLFTAAILLFSTLAAADHPRRQVVVASGPLTVVDRDHLARKLSRIERLLEEAQARIGGGPAARNVRVALEELEELELALGLDGAPGATAPPPPPGPPPAPSPISEPAFASLLDAIARERRSEDQLRIVEQAAPANWFLVDQVAQLLGRIRSDAHKLRAVAALRSRMLDPNNAFRLYALFPSSADKAALKRMLTDGASAEMHPISEQELRDLLQAMSEKWHSEEVLQLLAERASNHWFLIAHVQRITDAIFAPSDKLKALRILKPRILDPENHEQLAKSFFSPSDQEEVRKILR